jgi:hypothetical protein
VPTSDIVKERDWDSRSSIQDPDVTGAQETTPMKVDEPVDAIDGMTFTALFAADWLLGPEHLAKLLPGRWEKLHDRILARASRNGEGAVYPVERRCDLTPEQFSEQYFVPGIPVVLERAAAEWPAIEKWTPNYLNRLCGNDEIAVLDGHNWTVNRDPGKEAVSTAANTVRVQELISSVTGGGDWYGAFLEVLDTHADLREDLDLSFVKRFGQTNLRIPWQRNILARMYVGGPNTATSLHCAGVSNLFVQIYGRKKWVLISPRYTPFMYPAATRGINWQSRVDFRDPDYVSCPLYRFVDRYETLLGPGDVLWNPPFVWHGVVNLTESIAVSLWWTNVTRAFRNNVLLSALTLCGRPNPIAMQLGLNTIKDCEAPFSVHLNR